MNAANFQGAVGFYTPAHWTVVNQHYSRSVGFGLDARPAVLYGPALEVDSLAAFTAKSSTDGVTYRRVPSTSFAIDSNNRTALIQDINSYSKKAVWDGVSSWLNNGGPPVTKFSSRGTSALPVALTGDGLYMSDNQEPIDLSKVVHSAIWTLKGKGTAYGLN